MGAILDSDCSVFLPLLIFSLSLNFPPSNFVLFEAGKPRRQHVFRNLWWLSARKDVWLCSGVQNKDISEVYGSSAPFP